mmetsp:Transcript_42385/g.121762  ORF Transcript_42385/g.121762 Transcript_42385/m.121762 type:complete len:213 (+) Transcript_42385:208-846(+)
MPSMPRSSPNNQTQKPTCAASSCCQRALGRGLRRPEEERDGDPWPGGLLRAGNTVGVVLVPRRIEVHRLAALQTAPFASACAPVATGREARHAVRHRVQLAEPRRAQRVANRADALAKRAGAVRPRALLAGVDVAVLVVVRLAGGVEVHLHRRDVASVHRLAVLHELQHHLRARGLPAALEHPAERRHGLVAVEGAEDELAARLPHGTLLGG